MHQETLTVVAPASDPQSALRALGELAGAPGSMPAMFGNAALGIHFARITFVDAGRAASRDFKSFVVMESNFDTSETSKELAELSHLQVLAATCQDELASVFRHCKGGTSDIEAGNLAQYFQKRRVPATASYQGHANRTVERIRLESHLREVILAFLERAPNAKLPTLFARVRDHVIEKTKTDGELSGLDLDRLAPTQPDPEQRSASLRNSVWPWIENAWVAVPLVLRVPQILAWDATDKALDVRASQEQWTSRDFRRFASIAATEDHCMQNSLTHVVPLRTGRGRQSVLRRAHAYIDRMAKRHFNHIGQLGGIPSIHFAKWFLIDEGRRLAFFSNYDSSWESYLGNFVDEAALGLNLAWSCTEGYPRTRLLAFKGAADEEPFKAWGRAHQLPTQVFYSAYPTLSVASINNNTWIRHGLHVRGPQDLTAWFRRLS